jgi:hypothetical protein
MKYLISILTLLLVACASDSHEPTIIVKDNAAKDVYIDKLEAIVSDAAAGVKAVKETINKQSSAYILLESQELRLSGIKPPSVVKVDEYRSIITNNDTKRAEADKVKASETDKETTELYATVLALDSQLAEEKAKREESDRIAERALKQEFRTSLQNYGMYLTIAGILVVAFLKNFFKSGIVMILGGVILVVTAYYAEHPAVIWILGGTAALVALEILWLGFKYIRDKHFGKKDLPKE